MNNDNVTYQMRILLDLQLSSPYIEVLISFWTTLYIGLPELDHVIMRTLSGENVLNVSPTLICGFFTIYRKSTITELVKQARGETLSTRSE